MSRGSLNAAASSCACQCIDVQVLTDVHRYECYRWPGQREDIDCQDPNVAMVTGLPAEQEDCSVHRWQQPLQHAI